MPHATQSPPPQGTATRPAPAATFGGITRSASRAPAPSPDYAAIAESREFRELRARFRRFAFPMSAAFLVWYLGYVIVAAYLPDFMATRIVGEINVGLIMGMGQFATTILITFLYLRYAARHIDPRVRELYQNAAGEEPR
ncbi:hypothetical protein GCM10011581_47330 [Saccharopolyspora subtropica]|uniref:DUF485 domain-containing protein n=1 Tax=Saccharopolyspora thermophila TaxID=89367 RepID=A0A917KAR3_9PSEU|nr:DUF485 domain-containing protein [Saccharopolyspora subtropica]GGJ04845.1 hypothetical protein GCM10011581_47330 [Saccharopolyspora subtropica]